MSYRQVTLLLIALGMAAVLFNAFMARYLPYFEGAILFFDIKGFLAAAITL